MDVKYCVGSLLLLLLVCPAVFAQENPYQKVAVITFSYSGAGITEQSSVIQYGIPPNLNIQTGTISGILLDAQHKPITEFSLRDPRIQVGDVVSTGDSGQVVSGTTEFSGSGQFAVTVPFTSDLRYVTLQDTATGTPLATADLSPAIAAFRQIYPKDPDMMAIPAPAPSQNTSMLPGILLAAGILVMGASGSAYYFLYLRRRPARILIVDDEKEVGEVLSLLLGKKGYVTELASSGEQCLSLLKAWWRRPDIILLDVKMYPMDGWETLEEIKRKPSLKKIPVLMLTGIAPTPSQARKYGLLIDDYIIKPVRSQDLYSSIDYVMKRRELIKKEIRAATNAGYEKEMVCEYARLRRWVEVDRKLLGILRTDRSGIVSVESDFNREIDTVNREVKSREETLNRLLVKLSPVIVPRPVST